MKHMSKFSRFVRILAMFLCVAMVAGMVGTNAAIAADAGTSTEPYFIISSPTQDQVWTYYNKGTESDFKPGYILTATINPNRVDPAKVDAKNYKVLFNWQEVEAETGDWINSPTYNLFDEKVGNYGEFKRAVDPKIEKTGHGSHSTYSWKTLTEDFNIGSTNGLETARMGTVFRCVLRLYQKVNGEWKEIGSTISKTYKVDYLCEVNIYQGNKIATTVNVSYGQKLVISENVFGANSEVKLYTDPRMRDRDAYDTSSAVKKGMNLYAKVTTKHAVEFVMNDHGTQVETQYIKDGQTATKPANPTDDDYNFEGWFQSDMQTPFDFGAAITADTKVYAKWSEKVQTFKVTFTSDGHGFQDHHDTVVAKTTITPLPDPKCIRPNDAHVFIEWCSDEELKNKFDFTQPIIEDTIIYGKWGIAVTFVTGIEGLNIDTQKVAFGDKVLEPTVTSDEYEILGWYTNKNLSANSKYTFGNTVARSATGFTLYAKVEKIVHPVVTFKSVCGNLVELFDETTVNKGATVSAPEYPSYEGWSFNKWYKDADCTEEFDFTKGITENTTVYAKYTINQCTVTFDMNGHGTNSSKDVNYGTTLTDSDFPAASDIEGWKFLGWFADAQCNEAFDAANSPIKSAKTVFAGWEAVVSNVTLKGTVKTNYFVKDSLDIAGLSFVVKKGDTETEVAVKATDVTGFDSSAAGSCDIVIAYDDAHKFEYTLTISKKSSSIDYNGDEVVEKVYGDTFAIDFNADGTQNVTFESSDESVAVIDGNGGVKVVGVGQIQITLTLAGDDEFEGDSASFTLISTPKVIDIAWSNVGPYTYDSNPHTPKATIASTLVGDDVLTVSVNVIGSMYGVGTFIATASIDNDNYKISESTKSIECVINPQEVPAIELSFAKLVCGYTIDEIRLNNTTWVIKVPTEDGVVAQKVSVVKRLLTEATAAESSDGAFVGDVMPISLPTWPNFQQNLGSNLFVTGSGLLYKASLEEIESIVKANGTMPNSFTGTVVGGTQYVLAMTFIVNPNLKLPEQGTITATIDGKAAKVLYVKDTRVTSVSSYTVYVEFTAEHIPGEEQEENYVAPKCLEDGGVDHVVRCTACEKILSSEHETLNKTDHKWGEWIQDKDLSAKEAGHKYRKCENDPSHIDEASIDKLPAEVEKITIVIPDSAKKQYWVDEKLDVMGIEVVLSLTDGTEQKIPVTANMVTGFDSSKAADAQKLTVTYQGESANYNVAIRDVFYTVTGDLKWTRGKNMRLTVHRNFDDQLTFGKFVKLMIGGKVVDKSAFKAWSGSLELEIYNDYLDALDAGDYDLYIEFEDGSVEAKITVPERAQKEEKPEETTPEEVTPEENETKPEEKKNDTPESPKTADTAQTYVWTILLSIAVVLMLAVVVIRRRREDAE